MNLSHHKGEFVSERTPSSIPPTILKALLQTQHPEYIGKYEVLRALGQGSTSTVYLVDDPFAQRKVALKLFDPQLLTHEGFKRKVQKIFHNEASLIGQLRHPHILEVYDAIADTQGSYLVMEYVSGGTLESYCCLDRLMPIEQVIEVIFKCSRALDHAYRHGVIHRDIKPANILLTQSGDVKVSDFGSAMWIQSETTQLQEGGSPAYMSPEQIQQEPLSEQTDIYSLGMVMYELLTGQYPYEDKHNVHLSHQILHGDLISPSLYRDDIFPELERIVLKALHHNVEQRYGSWKEFGDDLLGIASRPIICRSLYESDTKKFKTLQSLRFFEYFDDVQLWEVLRFSHWRKLDQDTQIIREGDTGESFFILAKGQVIVSRGGVKLAKLGIGDCFGEMLYFSSTSAIRDTSVTVSEDSQVIEIKATVLSQATDACQVQFNKAYLRILDAKLSRMVQLASRQVS